MLRVIMLRSFHFIMLCHVILCHVKGLGLSSFPFHPQHLPCHSTLASCLEPKLKAEHSCGPGWSWSTKSCSFLVKICEDHEDLQIIFNQSWRACGFPAIQIISNLLAPWFVRGADGKLLSLDDMQDASGCARYTMSCFVRTPSCEFHTSSRVSPSREQYSNPFGALLLRSLVE